MTIIGLEHLLDLSVALNMTPRGDSHRYEIAHFKMKPRWRPERIIRECRKAVAAAYERLWSFAPEKFVRVERMQPFCEIQGDAYHYGAPIIGSFVNL